MTHYYDPETAFVMRNFGKINYLMLAFYAIKIVLIIALAIVLLSVLELLTLSTFAICILLPAGIAAGFLYYMFKDSFTNKEKKNDVNPGVALATSQYSLNTDPQRINSAQPTPSTVAPLSGLTVNDKHSPRLFQSASDSLNMPGSGSAPGCMPAGTR